MVVKRMASGSSYLESEDSFPYLANPFVAKSKLRGFFLGHLAASDASFGGLNLGESINA
jgi:hypothetical protein